MMRRIHVCLLALALISCAGPKSRRGPQPSPPGSKETLVEPTAPIAPGTSAPGTSTPGTSTPGTCAPGTYRIDRDQSELRVLVYRAGPLGNLGHNHVISNRAVEGAVRIAATPAEDSSIDLIIPVDSFVVDEAAARREEGTDFAGDIPQEAKSGTLHNMLSAALLNSAAYPTILMHSERIEQLAGGFSANFAVTVAGRASRLTVPFTLRPGMSSLQASGALEVRQTALGLTPYSLLQGALQVRDTIIVKFNIVALRQAE